MAGLVLNHKNKREGEQDLAHAIDLHLANNLNDGARNLAEHFMPSEGDPFGTENSITNSTGANEVEPMKKGISSSEVGS